MTEICNLKHQIVGDKDAVSATEWWSLLFILRMLPLSLALVIYGKNSSLPTFPPDALPKK